MMTRGGLLAGASLLLCSVLSCDGNPSEPLPGALSAQAGDPAASVTIEPRDAELVPNEVLALTAVAKDAQGGEIKNPNVEWASLDTDVADFVTQGERNKGELTALSDTSATARVTATVDAVADTVEVRVVPLGARLMVIDSTQLDLVSTSEQLAQGTYVFDVLQEPENLQDLLDGTLEFVAGDEGATFYRHVTSVASSGAQVTLETEDAVLEQVFKKGGKAKGKVPLKLGPRGRETRDCEGGRGVKCKEPGPQGEAIPSAASGDLGLFPDGFDLCIAPSKMDNLSFCPSVTVGGSLDFDLGLDVDVSVAPAELTLAASGGIEWDLDYVIGLAGQVDLFELEKEITIAQKPVVIMNIPGKLKLLLVPGVRGSLGGEVTISGNVSGSASATVGAKCTTGGCNEILDGTGSTSWAAPSFEARADAEVRLYFVTRLKLEWAGNEPALDIGSFFGVAGDASEFDHLVHDGVTMYPRLHAGMAYGLQGELAYEFEVMGKDFAEISLSTDILSQPILDWWGQGEVEVSATTTGIDLDPNGYLLGLSRTYPDDDPVWPDVLEQRIAYTGTAVLEPPARPCVQYSGDDPQDCYLVGTRHRLDIGDVMWNCEVEGETDQDAHMHPFGRIEQEADVSCISVFVALSNTIDEMLASGEIDNHGIANGLKQLLRNADAQRMEGKPGPAANMLDAFMAEVEAQTRLEGGSDPATLPGPRPTPNKHIAPAAAHLLIERATQIREGYLTNILVG